MVTNFLSFQLVSTCSLNTDFFWQRCISNGLKPIDVLGRPFLDLRTVAVIMNRGEFNGSGLDQYYKQNLMVEATYHNGMKKKNMQRLKITSRKRLMNLSIFCSKLYKELPVHFYQTFRQ